MSSLMEDAIAKARELPKEQQDAIATMILEAIEIGWLYGISRTGASTDRGERLGRTRDDPRR